ncbi:MAG TPA: hypothetical protein VMT35_18235 [Ignavibacteriaceae bacterium]|nr:hypothetical protein [Ignavibacteriaceae bacterium]
MKTLPLFFAAVILIYSGCKSPEQKISKPEVDASGLRQLIVLATNGSKIANDSLAGLVDQSTSVQAFNELKVESIQATPAKKLFTVLIEYPNPLYNRFAVYDQSMNPLLIDKSLNGWLSMEPLTVDSVRFVKVMESFNSKDILEFERLSLYKIENDSVYLALRIFTKFKEPTSINTQKIQKFNRDTILTQINTPAFRRNISDAFYFNNETKSYRSQNDLFKQFILNQIKNITQPVQSPQIE